MPGHLSAIVEVTPQLLASATLRVDTPGAGFTDITGSAAEFIDKVRAGEGTLFVYLRHTSASLAIQENADPDVQSDLIAALDRLAPENALALGVWQGIYLVEHRRRPHSREVTLQFIGSRR